MQVGIRSLLTRFQKIGCKRRIAKYYKILRSWKAFLQHRPYTLTHHVPVVVPEPLVGGAGVAVCQALDHSLLAQVSGDILRGHQQLGTVWNIRDFKIQLRLEDKFAPPNI